MTLSQRVAVIEQANIQLRKLNGEILATLLINVERNTLMFEKPEHKEQFSGFLDKWAERLDKIMSLTEKTDV